MIPAEMGAWQQPSLPEQFRYSSNRVELTKLETQLLMLMLMSLLLPFLYFVLYRVACTPFPKNRNLFLVNSK
jgi:hypothetical protein